jgi:peptidoglycan hydrolase-like protein with peptidoglycan-binding domain
MRGSEVLALQTYLAGKGYMDFDHTTGYFGPITAAALARYRADMLRSPVVAVGCPANMICTPILGATVGSTSPAGAIQQVRLSTFLSLGSRHPDVLVLQKFLNRNNFLVALSGPGSSGNETDFFGPATRAAVIRFQEAHPVQLLVPLGVSQGTGVVDTKTIQVINSLLSQ